MEVGPFTATIGGKATIKDSQLQTWPVRAVDIRSRKHVALLHRSRNGTNRQLDAISINQGHMLATDHQLGRVITTRAAHRDALDRLCVDDPQCRCRTTSRRAPPPPRTSGGRTGHASASAGTSHTPSATAAGARVVERLQLGPVVATNDTRYSLVRQRHPLEPPQHSISACRHGEVEEQSRTGFSPPRAAPACPCASTSLRVRWAHGMIRSGRRSTKV